MVNLSSVSIFYDEKVAGVLVKYYETAKRFGANSSVNHVINMLETQNITWLIFFLSTLDGRRVRLGQRAISPADNSIPAP